MASVTVNGVTYTDDSDANTGLANGGHRTRFVPLLSNVVVDLAAKVTAAQTAQAASVVASGVVLWVSGTTYAIGDKRLSPINSTTYRRLTSGAGTTDPSLDATNWAVYVVPVGAGGTGADTAAVARANLGAAASGANADITSRGNNTSTQYTSAGTLTAYTITPSPVIAAYTAGQSFFVNFHVASGAAPTLAINGIATPPNLIKENIDGSYSNIAAGDITVNHRSRVTLLNPIQALVEKLPGSGVPGTIIMFASATAPAGYLVVPIAASNISRTTYADLFAAIGTTWGVGDGSTTFGLPFCPSSYTFIQGNGTVGTSSLGLISDHTHPIVPPNGANSSGGTVLGHSNVTGAIQSVVNANLAAGVNIRYCVKY